MKSADSDILYYGNGRGGAAVSLDDGITVIVATGRTLDRTGVPMWEETDLEDIEALLTEPQKKAIQDYRNRPPLTPLQEMAERLRRKTALRLRRENAQPNSHTYLGQLGEEALVVMSEED